MVAPMVEGMDRISVALGIPRMDSESSVTLSIMLQAVADISRWVLATLTIPVGTVDKKGTLRMTVSDRTCRAVVAMTTAPVGATVFVACKATIPLISSLDGLA